MQAYELIPSPAEKGLIQVVKEARQSLFIAAPYIKDYGTKFILSNASVGNLQMLTNLNIANVTGTGFDIDALLALWAKFDVQVSSLGKLHAKTYIADSRIAFVTSANLTRGGLVENYEYGLVLRDEQLVSAMLDDMKKYFALGNVFSREKIEGIRDEITQIRDLQEALAKSGEAKHLRKALRQKEDALQTRLLENRVEGKSLNAIFSETITYLLGSRGASFNPRVEPSCAKHSS